MITTAFVHEIYGNFTSTIMAFAILFIIYLILTLFFARRIESHRQRHRFRVRTLYIMILVLIFIMARIWVEGFTHLLAVLGLVSAALVVTNKETIMNVVGSLIIRWRSLFSEGDLIQLQQYKGYVKSVGVLYFNLEEVGDHSNVLISGRIVKIPNGLVANNTLINFSQTMHLQLRDISLIVTKESDVGYCVKQLKKIIDDVLLKQVYKDKKEYSENYLKTKHKKLANIVSQGTTVTIRPKFDKPNGVELTARYYCFEADYEMIEQKLWKAILAEFADNKHCELAYLT